MVRCQTSLPDLSEKCRIRPIVAHPIVAQALLEKGLLDRVFTGISEAFIDVGRFIQSRPYLLIVLGVVLYFLLRRRR